MAETVRVTDVPRLPARQRDSHKGTYGRVLVVAGSRGMTGAAILCGSAALRGGAGLVTVSCPADVQNVIAAGNPCYMTAGWSVDPADAVRTLAAQVDVVAIGPGLGTTAAPIVAAALRMPGKPVVVDADGLNALGRVTAGAFVGRTATTVLTPHPGEFARLTSRPTADVQAHREQLAVDFAQTHKIVLLLKGHQTVVTDGNRIFVNNTGNPGMATGGCGDVLTGLIAALIGQGLSGFDAALLAAWVHGRAGDLAAAEVGQTALTAIDVLAYLPKALREVGP
jgi:ADP-dependent NAD(P)H-hydrate dehydratase